MVECELCGKTIKAKEVCYLETTNQKTGARRILKVCKGCKYER